MAIWIWTDKIKLRRESPITYVETIVDLVGDNTGPLVKFHNLDKGLLVIPRKPDTSDIDND